MLSHLLCRLHCLGSPRSTPEQGLEPCHTTHCFLRTTIALVSGILAEMALLRNR